MRNADLEAAVAKLSQSGQDIVRLLSAIEFYRGKTFAVPTKTKLNRLHERARRYSVTASNAIEGIKVDKKDEEAIFDPSFSPNSAEAKALLGYNKALGLIFDTYQYQSLDEGFIKNLHRLLWSEIDPSHGGYYKTNQNYIRTIDVRGKISLAFTPASPIETGPLMGDLVYQFTLAWAKPEVNRLLLIFVFILDFLCIHPFEDGNGRVSRLLTTFLLLKAGYGLEMYYSLSYLILDDLEQYYSSLSQSSTNWESGANDYAPFVSYMLRELTEGYRRLDYLFTINNQPTSLKEKIYAVVTDSYRKIGKAEIEETLYSYSRSSIEKALGELVKEGRIVMVHAGKHAGYVKSGGQK